jgi:hypothetical protein
MRNSYEAYILVKLKDGSQYVCAMNRPRQQPLANQRLAPKQQQVEPDKQVIWN